ncbi:ADOP family duplicated permease [Acidicapsa dinghuensis]|uniref:ADOP family duplicated permease n=1 Tax=Acidicapsa dinghuensis TaxID=2218256 RepID=A0ABW1ECL7_9BACT|nr:ABC transporter permease [Acidicapsa dinghuensis]
MSDEGRRARWTWQRRKEDLCEELEAHLRLAIADRVARGENPEEARAAALKEMGNLPLIADVTRRQWGWEWAESLWQDLRYAMRQLRKSPGYTMTALLTLTLAIGANTAIFGLMYALLLRSLPVYRPDQLVQVELKIGPANSSRKPNDRISGGEYDVLNGSQHVFQGMCGWLPWPSDLHDRGNTIPIPTARVTGGCFEMLGVHAALGRLLTAADDRPGGGPEGYPAVLGYDYWRTRFGADPHVLGHVLNIHTGFSGIETKCVVVGVMEPGFQSVNVEERPWVYLPSDISTKNGRHGFGSFSMTLLARLRPRISPAAAQAQIDPLFGAKLKTEKFQYATSDNGSIQQTSEAHLLVVPAKTGFSDLRENYAKPLYLIEGMVGLSMLVACAFLATLASTRALARRRELALRIALGASRIRVIRQLCCESLLLATGGSLLGIFFAWISEQLLLDLIATPGSEPPALSVTPDTVVLLFTVGLSVLTVFLAGVGPAWRATRIDPTSDIKAGESYVLSRRGSNLGSLLIPIQIGFSLTILVIAALMSSTVARLLAVDPGFRTSGVTFFSADFSPRAKGYSAPLPLVLSLLDRIRQFPGVESVSVSQAHQLQSFYYVQSAKTIASTGEKREDPMIPALSVGPGYFQTLGIPLIAGRDFTSEDRNTNAQVCILSRTAANFFFPDKHALGATLLIPDGHKEVQVQVIGITGDTLYQDFRDHPRRILYQPYLSGETWNPIGQIAVRSANTAAAVEAVRTSFRELAPEVALDNPETISELVGHSMSRERLLAVLSSFFAVLTLGLTAIGLYGLLSYAVIRRRPEIGVRMALGASPAGVVRMIVRDASRLVLPGILLGALGAWASTRLLGNLLFGIKPLDPAACAASVLLLAAAVTLACVLPAKRAASVQPMEALRRE